jgi:hypothetical protein
MNACKDGLYAESRIIRGEYEHLYNNELEIWCRGLGLAEGAEGSFGSTSFDSLWKYRRALRALEAQHDADVEDARVASAEDPLRERIEAEAIAENIHKEPRASMLALIQTIGGCDWAIARWQSVLDEVRDDDCLETSQHTMIWCLLGKRPTEILVDRELREFNRAWLGTLLHNQPHLTVDDLMKWYGEHEPAPEVGFRADESKRRLGRIIANDLPESSAAAAALLRELIGKQIARLRDRAERLRRERATRAALAVEAAGLPDTIAAGRRERHVATLYRRAERGVELALKLRKARLAEGGDVRDEDSRPDMVVADGRPAPARTTTPEPPRCAAQVNVEHQSDPSSGNAHPPAGAAPPPASERPGGPSAGVLAILLFLLVPLLGGPGREGAPGPHGARDVLEAIPRAQGAWGRSPQGQTPDAPPPQPAAARRVGRGPTRRAEAHRDRHRVRQASVGLRPQGQTPNVPAPPSAAAGASPAPGRLDGRVGRGPTHRVEAHRRRPSLRWASSRSAGFDPPYVCRNDPELDASRVASRSSSCEIVKVSRTDLRPRDSPGLRGPPRRRS